jgi:peptidoglycan hydrolase-like protein with peptidoglycan-binding domain
MRKKIFAFMLSAILGIIIPSSFASAAFDRNLQYGDSGEDVRELQEFLTEEGVYNGTITGNYYSLTRMGVKMFQKKYGISPAFGNFAILTRTKVNLLLAKQAALLEQNTQVDANPGSVEPVTPIEIPKPQIPEAPGELAPEQKRSQEVYRSFNEEDALCKEKYGREYHYQIRGVCSQMKERPMTSA